MKPPYERLDSQQIEIGRPRIAKKPLIAGSNGVDRSGLTLLIDPRSVELQSARVRSTAYAAPFRATLFALALGAILFRGLIAPGWMPAGGVDGPRIVFCAGADAMAAADAAQAAFDARLSNAPTKHKPAPQQPCAFAAFGLALDRPEATAALALSASGATAPLAALPATVFFGHGLAAPPPPATGPPAFI